MLVYTFGDICVKQTVADDGTAYNPGVAFIGRILQGQEQW